MGENASGGIEASPDDLKLIQRILGLALRGRILAEERSEATTDNPTPDKVTTLYAKLAFRKEGQLFVPQVIFYSSLNDDYYRSNPDYPFLLEIKVESEE